MKAADIQRACSQRKRLFSLPGWPLWLAALGFLVALPAVAQVGATLDELVVKGTVYRGVKVLSATPAAMTIRHAGGLTQVPLRDLPAELQSRMGYDPVAAVEYDRCKAQAESARLEAEAQRQAGAAGQAPSAAPRSTRDVTMVR